MGFNLFCKHDKYEVLTWRYQNLGKPDQYIMARIKCNNCGKILEKTITGDRMNAFAVVYDDKFGR
jgi:lysyl-tRNA synthetase class I